MTPKRNITAIIVHHSVSAWGDGDTIKHWHTDPKPRGNGWKVPGYHVVITNGWNTYPVWQSRNRGPVRVDRILNEQLVANGCKYANANSLHVCLIGDFDKSTILPAQRDKLIDLLTHWCRTHGLAPANIYGHGEMQKKIGKEGYSKTCPGKTISMSAIRMEVARRLGEVKS